LALNVKRPGELGIKIDPALAALADEVIEWDPLS
jgi:hypothetical protein